MPRKRLGTKEEPLAIMAAGAKDLPSQETKKVALKIEDPSASALAIENKHGSSLQHKARHDTEHS